MFARCHRKYCEDYMQAGQWRFDLDCRRNDSRDEVGNKSKSRSRRDEEGGIGIPRSEELGFCPEAMKFKVNRPLDGGWELRGVKAAVLQKLDSGQGGTEKHFERFPISRFSQG